MKDISFSGTEEVRHISTLVTYHPCFGPYPEQRHNLRTVFMKKQNPRAKHRYMGECSECQTIYVYP